MEVINHLDITTRAEFRSWLEKNHDKQRECWVRTPKGRTSPEGLIWYLDAVEEALCFGWIDTTHKNIDGIDLQKFTPRSKKSPWSELNKERCRRLKKLGLMTPAGEKVLPDMREKSYVIDEEILTAFKANRKAWSNFRKFPPRYQRLRIDSIQRDKKKDHALFLKRTEKLIRESEKGNMFGEWNDYGRLLEE